MKRSQATPIMMASLMVVAAALPVAAAEDGFAGASHGPFKLHAVAEYAPELMIADGWHVPKSVDSSLVNQIGQVRLSLPSLNGLHHMMPGLGAAHN